MKIKDNKINNIALQLFEKINKRQDLFDDITIITPSNKISEFIKKYYLKTYNRVLMNVSFHTLNEYIPTLLQLDDYKIITSEELTIIIINILLSYEKNKLNEQVKNYIYDNDVINNIRLFDYSSKLASLFIEYDDDDFEITGYQHDIYNLVQKEFEKHKIGTKKYLYTLKCEYKKIDNLYFFGFLNYTKIEEKILDEYINIYNVDLYELEKVKTSTEEVNVTSCASKLREIEYVHGQICKKINEGSSLSDFLVITSNLSEYIPYIERVFNQDDINFPYIPYTIIDRDRSDSDTYSALKDLYTIMINQSLTRNELLSLLNNNIITSTRNITPEQKEAYIRMIISTNTYRNTNNYDDWNYLKTRLLLSKVSDINDKENIVNINNDDFIPYSNISINDEAIIKFVNLIDDIKYLIELYKNSSINELKREIPKWLSVTNDNGDETNIHYKKIVDTLNKVNTLTNNNIITIDILFNLLFNKVKFKQSISTNLFSRGISFVEFDVNSVLYSKYIYFLGAQSNNLPVKKVKSEIDIRPCFDNGIVKSKETFILQQINSQEFYVTYISINLKNNEEYYITSLIDKLCNEPKNITLDESRDYSELFTKNEYKNKESKINNSIASNTSTKVKSNYQNQNKFTLSNFEKFLKEGFSYKANELFGSNDDKEDELKNNYEPFVLNSLDNSIIVTEILLNLLNNTFNKDKMINELKLSHVLPIINNDVLEHAFDSSYEKAYEVYKYIVELDSNYEILSLDDLKLTSSDEKWILSCNKKVCRCFKDNIYTYIELKSFKDASNADFLYLYLFSLMDLCLSNDINRKIEITRARTKSRTYEITKEEALNILNEIYQMINDYSNIKYIDIDSKSDKMLDKSQVVKSTFNSWKYFKNDKMFNKWDDLGYSDDNTNSEYENEFSKITELIKYIM